MSNQLTDRELWKNYWGNYHFTPVSDHPIYKKYVPAVSRDSRFIEIGGFPGLNAAYFYKHACKNVTLLNFYVERDIIRKVEVQNNIPEGTIQTIEADFFTFQPTPSYDIVFSLGFIEHFQDTKDVIKRHYDLLTDKGSLLIALPNLRGLNGLVQYLFDRENLHIHNLRSMNIGLLHSIAQELGLRNICVEYTRKPMIWLEPKPGLTNKIGHTMTKMTSYLIKLFPIRCRLLSPYIIISGTK